MKLAVFDIDGTLVRSKNADGECYALAWKEEFGVDDVSAETADFVASTDSGITLEVFRERLGLEPGAGEIARLKARFMALLRERVARDRQEFEEVPGAAEALARLRSRPEWMAAVATGCWRESAVLKLGEAGIDAGGLALATSDDAVAREEIVSHAVEQAKRESGCAGFEKIVYIGDGAWDVRAAAALGAAFVGVCDGGHAYRQAGDPAAPRAKRGTPFGAAVVVRDYSDFELFMKALEDARVP